MGFYSGERDTSTPNSQPNGDSQPIIYTNRGRIVGQGLLATLIATGTLFISSNFDRIAGAAGSGAATIERIGAGLDGLVNGDEITRQEELDTEACVSKLVGEHVDLVPDEDRAALQLAPGVGNEQVACQTNGNDPNLAIQAAPRLTVEPR